MRYTRFDGEVFAHVKERKGEMRILFYAGVNHSTATNLSKTPISTFAINLGLLLWCEECIVSKSQINLLS